MISFSIVYPKNNHHHHHHHHDYYYYYYYYFVLLLLLLLRTSELFPIPAPSRRLAAGPWSLLGQRLTMALRSDLLGVLGFRDVY